MLFIKGLESTPWQCFGLHVLVLLLYTYYYYMNYLRYPLQDEALSEKAAICHL